MGSRSSKFTRDRWASISQGTIHFLHMIISVGSKGRGVSPSWVISKSNPITQEKLMMKGHSLWYKRPRWKLNHYFSKIIRLPGAMPLLYIQNWSYTELEAQTCCCPPTWDRSQIHLILPGARGGTNCWRSGLGAAVWNSACTDPTLGFSPLQD